MRRRRAAARAWPSHVTGWAPLNTAATGDRREASTPGERASPETRLSHRGPSIPRPAGRTFDRTTVVTPHIRSPWQGIRQ
jgi:hypothetical protein